MIRLAPIATWNPLVNKNAIVSRLVQEPNPKNEKPG